MRTPPMWRYPVGEGAKRVVRLIEKPAVRRRKLRSRALYQRCPAPSAAHYRLATGCRRTAHHRQWRLAHPFLPDGHTTVGYAVDGMRHMAPTPIGGRVRLTAVLTEVDRNRLTYSIEAYEGDKKIGVAIHKRAVVSTDPDG